MLVHCVNAAAMDSSAVIDKIERLAEKLAQFQARLCLVVVPFGQLQDVLIASIPAEERMLCYRHCMTRVASLVADQRGSSLIATGDSYGQVASQVMGGFCHVLLCFLFAFFSKDSFKSSRNLCLESDSDYFAADFA